MPQTSAPRHAKPKASRPASAGASSPAANPVAAAASDAPAGPRRTDQQRRILTAALACFARDGFHGASMQSICAEAGMSPGALYRHFPSKEALIAAIVEDERAERLSVFDAVAKTPTILGGLMDCMRTLLAEDALPTMQLGPEIMAEAIRNAKLREAIEPCEEETRVLLRGAIAEAVARGEVADDLPLDDIIIMLQLIGDGVVLHHKLHPEWDLVARLPRLAALVQRMLAPADLPHAS